MARDDPYFRLRIPEALKAQIEKSAAESNRSMTAEIISRLERSYETTVSIEDMASSIEELHSRLLRMEVMVHDHHGVLSGMVAEMNRPGGRKRP